jgi:DNA repair protein RadA/Sms
MSKTTSIYQCSNCDSQFPKWQGRCLECGKWGTLQQTVEKKNNSSPENNVASAEIVSFNNISKQPLERLSTGLTECDRVLGGGIVQGSLILIGGDPGIGKSTLVLHICHGVKKDVLYISGEESASQVKNRIDRLGINYSKIHFVSDTNIETIIATISKEKPALAIIDSVQTMYSADVPSTAGSVNQVRACTALLLEAAKKNNVAIVIVGHVTKTGEVAGPKTLEHLVDAVFYLEGEQHQNIRILRATKNRFGATAEIGIFEMNEDGLKEILNPAGLFLGQKASVPGSIITATVEGSRVFLLEVQALVTPTHYNYPQRKSVGFDSNRLQLLIATLTRQLGLKLATHDIYLNVAGGFKANEPAADLAVCLAIISSLKSKTALSDTIVVGEVGLGGEVRQIPHLDKRLSESEAMGFKKIIMPNQPIKSSSKKIKICPIEKLADSLAYISS